MTTRTRRPTAPTEPMPESAEFLAPFGAQFTRREGPAALERYCTGLRTEHPNENCDTLAPPVPGTSGRQLRGLRAAMAWDEGDPNRQRAGVLAGLPTEGGGVLVFDGTGFPEQGRSSVGVARQYSGPLGTTGDCQVAVACHYAERTLAGPVAARLYLPRPSPGDAARREKAGVPEEATFRTRPDIALDLPDRAKAWGVRWACVAADCDYGDNPNLLAGLDARDQRYVAAVRADSAAAAGRGAGVPSRRADALRAELPAGVWRSVRWREGGRGRLRGSFAAVRCWRVTADGTRHVGWLIGGGRPAASPSGGSSTGATSAPGCRWGGWPGAPTGGMGWSRSTRGRRRPWGGTGTRGGGGRGSAGTRSPRCWRTRPWSGRSGGCGGRGPGPAERGRLLPPGPDRRRESLPEVHRPVSDWVRVDAIREGLDREDIAAWLRPMRD